MPGRDRAKVTLAIAWNKFCVTGYHFSSVLKASQEQSAEVAAASAAAWAGPLLSGLLSSFSSYLFNWPLICFYFKQSLLVWSIGFHLQKQRQLSQSPLAVLPNSRRLCSRQRVGELLSRGGQSCHKSRITFTSLKVFFCLFLSRAKFYLWSMKMIWLQISVFTEFYWNTSVCMHVRTVCDSILSERSRWTAATAHTACRFTVCCLREKACWLLVAPAQPLISCFSENILTSPNNRQEWNEIVDMKPQIL